MLFIWFQFSSNFPCSVCLVMGSSCSSRSKKKILMSFLQDFCWKQVDFTMDVYLQHNSFGKHVRLPLIRMSLTKHFNNHAGHCLYENVLFSLTKKIAIEVLLGTTVNTNYKRGNDNCVPCAKNVSICNMLYDICKLLVTGMYLESIRGPQINTSLYNIYVQILAGNTADSLCCGLY